MLTRRETILGGALTLLSGRCACAQHAGATESFGCTLEPQQAESIFARATEPVAADKAEDHLISSSGNRAFDFALAQSLSRLTDMFGVLPGFSFFDDYENENAF